MPGMRLDPGGLRRRRPTRGVLSSPPAAFSCPMGRLTGTKAPPDASQGVLLECWRSYCEMGGRGRHPISRIQQGPLLVRCSVPTGERLLITAPHVPNASPDGTALVLQARRYVPNSRDPRNWRFPRQLIGTCRPSAGHVKRMTNRPGTLSLESARFRPNGHRFDSVTTTWSKQGRRRIPLDRSLLVDRWAPGVPALHPRMLRGVVPSNEVRGHASQPR